MALKSVRNFSVDDIVKIQNMRDHNDEYGKIVQINGTRAKIILEDGKTTIWTSFSCLIRILPSGIDYGI